jgi:hypothetical protein
LEPPPSGATLMITSNIDRVMPYISVLSNEFTVVVVGEGSISVSPPGEATITYDRATPAILNTVLSKFHRESLAVSLLLFRRFSKLIFYYRHKLRLSSRRLIPGLGLLSWNYRTVSIKSREEGMLGTG